jgi:3'-phosphoadenosine 5'-phosphosulfate sulfotransferase (PAPS reductase)/FAD synthetase
MYVIFGNYGNQTIAVMQWAWEQGLDNVYTVSVDTGWGHPWWQHRVEAAQEFADQCGFQVVRLQANPNFSQLVQQRQRFPSVKFQWCAGFLKGLPLLDWLEESDETEQATLILGKRRADSRANQALPEWIEAHEYYQRDVWHPLVAMDEDNWQQLITKAGFAVLAHRSLECDPCINSDAADFKRLQAHETVIQRVEQLEHSVETPMFERPIRTMVKQPHQEARALNALEKLHISCGSSYNCGE